MSVNLNLFQHPTATPHRVTVVRFARAVQSVQAVINAPDLDDHGFITTDGSAATGSANGPVVGLQGASTAGVAGRVVRVRVIRDRLDDAAQIFPVVEDSAVARVVFPQPLVPFNATELPTPASLPELAGFSQMEGDTLYLQGVASAEPPSMTKLRLHFGAVDGPVIAEMALVVFQPLVVEVQPHIVDITGGGGGASSPANWDLARVNQLFQLVNAAYAPAGVEFNVIQNMLSESIHFHTAGTVNIDDRNPEFDRVLHLHSDPNALNAYFVRAFNLTGVDGVGTCRTFTQGAATVGGRAGLQMCDDLPSTNAALPARRDLERGHVMAHEIGHALTLEHYNHRNADRVVHDLWTHRNLMNPTGFHDNSLSPTGSLSTPNRAFIGYGLYENMNPSEGQMLMIKKRTHIQFSDQVTRIRRAVRTNEYKP